MPEDITSLQIRVESLEVANANRNLDKFGREAAKAERATDKLTKRNRMLKTALVGVASVGVAGVTAALTIGVRKWLEYDKAMKEVHSITDMTSVEMNELRTEVLSLSAAMGVDAADSARSLYQAISAGVPKENAIDFLRTSSKLAIAGVTDTAIAVDGLTNVINAFKLETEDADDIANDLFKTVKLGKTTVEELSSNISKSSVTANALGIEYEELLASFISITKQGTQSSEAFTQQNALFTSLLKPTKELKLAYKAMGIESASAAIEAKGLDGFLNDLAFTFGENQEAVTKALGSTEAYKALLSTTGQNAQEVSRNLHDLRSDTDELTGAVEKNSETFDVAFNKLWASTQLFVEAANEATGATKWLIEYMNKAAEGAEYLAGKMEGLGSSVSAILSGDLATAWAEHAKMIDANSKTIGELAWDKTVKEFAGETRKATEAVADLNTELTQGANESKADFEFRKAMVEFEKDASNDAVAGTKEQIAARKEFNRLLKTGDGKPKRVGSKTGARASGPSFRDLQNKFDLGTEKSLLLNRLENERKVILETTNITEEQRTTLMEQHALKRNAMLEQLEMARISTIFMAAESGFGALAELTGKFAGEQSTAYKVLFGISKGFAVAEAAINVQRAISKAFAAGVTPIDRAVLVGDAIAQGATLMSTINSINPSFEDGGIVGGSSFTGDKVQANVNSGEMILNRGQQRELFNMANGNGNGSGGGVNIVINNLPGQEVDVKETETDQGKQLEFTMKKTEKYLATQFDKGAGPLTSSIHRNSNVARKGNY